MFFHIQLCKWAHIADTHNFYSEVTEEIHDVQGLVPQAKHEQEGRDEGTEQLFQHKHLGGEGNRNVTEWLCLHGVLLLAELRAIRRDN